MKNKIVIKIISIFLIILLICLLITYLKNDSKVVLATTKAVKEFNTENLKDNEHMHIEVDSSGDKVPVPNGYVGSKVAGENEIDTGYVIYEGTEEVNDSNVEEAQKTRNQYVWIPVPDVSKMYGTDENDRLLGKLYSFTINTGNNVDEVTGAKPLNWSENNKIITLLNQKNSREPDIAINRANIAYDSDSKIKLVNAEERSTHEFLIQLEQEFNSMVESGNRSREDICEDSTGWGNFRNSSFEYINSNGNTSIKNENSNMMIPTGSTEYTNANNIYDLAGNVSEWTMENSYTYIRIGRGGYSGGNDVLSLRYELYPDTANASRRLPCDVIYKIIKEERYNTFLFC